MFGIIHSAHHLPLYLALTPASNDKPFKSMMRAAGGCRGGRWQADAGDAESAALHHARHQRVHAPLPPAARAHQVLLQLLF